VREVLAAAAALLFAATQGVAFEFEGYSSGMSLDDISAVAAAQGDTLIENEASYQGVEFDGFYTIIRPDGQELSLSLCAGGLHSVYTLLAGGFHTFAEMATNLTGKYGPPVIDTQAVPPAEAQLPTSSVSLVWDTPEGEQISMHLDAQGEMAPLTSYGMSAIAIICPVAPEDGADKAAT
jgi:hypothetical protein